MRWSLLLLLFVHLSADIRESFEVGARLLYWKPISANDHYATTWQSSDQSDLGERRILKVQYSWGFQVDGRWTIPCRNFFTALNLIGIDFKSSDSVSSTGFLVPIPNGGEASTDGSSSISSQQTYAGGDLEAGLRILERDCLRLDLSAGGRYTYLRDKQANQINSESPLGSDLRLAHSSFKGAGPRLQMAFVYEEILPGLSFAARGAGTLLAGRRRLTASQSTTIGDDFSNRERFRDTALIPNLDFRLSFAYSVASPWACLTGEAGYELRHFFQPLWRAQPLFPNEKSFAFPQTTRLGFAGPYLAIRASF